MPYFIFFFSFLGLSLKPDQMHAVEKSLDSDGDGYVDAKWLKFKNTMPESVK